MFLIQEDPKVLSWLYRAVTQFWNTGISQVKFRATLHLKQELFMEAKMAS